MFLGGCRGRASSVRRPPLNTNPLGRKPRCPGSRRTCNERLLRRDGCYRVRRPDRRPRPPAPSEPQEPGLARQPIFRYMTARPHGIFRLGEPFDSTGILGVEIRPGIYRLDRKDGRPIQLGDTRAILVAVIQATNVVCAMHFLYLPDKDFEQAVSECEKDLGAARRSTRDSSKARIRSASWHDNRTQLVVRDTHTPAGSGVTSILEEHPSKPGCPR